ncbi:UDP-glucose 4-epimerase GalE [Acuticoccus sp.]|uniref:UDP-glucose 4-epimerase GalE n=1 Tax=Acuticoccus sp. TaxID=1904378 RepID=UPI003B52E6FC
MLVTGGAGYVGSHAVLSLLGAGHAVALVDNYANASRDVVERLRMLGERPFAAYEADIRDARALDAVLHEVRPQCVVHFAGLKAVVDSQADPLAYYDTNLHGTIELLRAMNRHGCRRMVFSSSAVVYGPARYLPVDEAHPVAPSNPYGRTKLFNEALIEDWVAATAGAAAVLLRYFNPVGAHPSGLIGEEPCGVPSNLMPVLLEVASGQRAELTVYGHDWPTRDGTGLRDFIHVTDLAEAHAAALEFVGGERDAHVFNVGTGRGATVLELVHAFRTATGIDIAVREEARRANDIGASVADPSKAERALGWSALRDLDDMCRSAWRWQLNRAAVRHGMVPRLEPHAASLAR